VKSSTSASAGTTTRSSSGGSTAASPSANPNAIAQANAICARRNRELAKSTPPGASLREIVGSASRRAKIQRAALAELQTLTPPGAVAREWRLMLADTAAALHGTEHLAQLAGRQGSAGLAHETKLLDKPRLGLLLAGSRAGAKRCSAVAGPSVLGL
jgi:hypothetical protein